MPSNNVRFDLSPYLIHFFRKLDLEKADAPYCPEDWGPGEIVEDTMLSPVFLLRNAIRVGRLWATWSIRGKRRTIYGPHPAVCFTDMPIAAFIEAGSARASKGQAMSPIALVLPKHDVHAAGARPVIYGLSDQYNIPKGDDGQERLLPVAALPLVEQYRYVTLGNFGAVDWTHEREWRWPFRGALPPDDGTVPINGNNLPGLNLDFSGMGVVVRTKKQAQKVLHDVLVRRDRGALRQYRFILVAEDVPSLTALRDPATVQTSLSAASIDLEPFFDIAPDHLTTLVAGFQQCVADVSRNGLPDVGREKGGCWLWIADPAHEMTRALALRGMALVNKNNRYLVRIDALDPARPLNQREELTRRLAEILKQRHGLDATYHSVLEAVMDLRLGNDQVAGHEFPQAVPL